MISRRAVAVVIVASAVALFGRTVCHDFVLWDDPVHLYENPGLTPPSLEKALRFWREPYAGLYVPATYSAWSLIATLRLPRRPPPATPLDPAPFHGANVALHAANGILVFLLLESVLGLALRRNPPDPGRLRQAAALGALLFTVHPLQAEPVCWATGLKDLLSATFGLFSIRLYLASAPWGAGAPGPRIRYAVASAAFALAMASKPSAVAVIALLVILDGWLLERAWPAVLGKLLPWALIAAAFVMATQAAQGPWIESGARAWERPLIALDSASFYLFKLLAPLRLAPDYGRTPERVLSSGTWWLTSGAAVCFVLLAWLARRRRPVLSAAAGLFLVALLPTSGIVPFLHQSLGTVADRYAYLALVGPALAVASVCAEHPRAWVRLAAAGGLVPAAVLCFLQVGWWHDTSTLSQRATEVNPLSWLGYTNQGAALQKSGRIADALPFYRKALEVNPDCAEAQNNLGTALLHEGRTTEAIDHYRKLLVSRPGFAGARMNLGIALETAGRTDEAVFQYQEAIRLEPDLAEAHYNLGLALESQGRLDQAVEHYAEALRRKPGFTPARESLDAALRKRTGPR